MKDLGPITWVWNWLPWYVQIGLIGYIAFTSIGGTHSLYKLTKSFAGRWAIPAMASLVIPLGLWVWSWMQKPAPEPHEHVSGKDALPAVKPAKKKPTKSWKWWE